MYKRVGESTNPFNLPLKRTKIQGDECMCQQSSMAKSTAFVGRNSLQWRVSWAK